MSWYEPIRSKINYPNYCNTAELRYFTTGEENRDKTKPKTTKTRKPASSNGSSTQQKPSLKRTSEKKTDGSAKKKKKTKTVSKIRKKNKGITEQNFL